MSAVKNEFILENLCCANCAAKIESRVGKLSGVETSVIDFVSKKLFVEVSGEKDFKTLVSEIEGIVSVVEPDVKVRYENKNVKKFPGKANVKGCSCEYDDSSKQEEEHHHGHSHDYSHSHDEGEELEFKQIMQFALGVLCFIAARFIKLNSIEEFALYFVSYLMIGGSVLFRAIRNIIKGEIFDENFLMALATVGAFAVGEYAEGVAVMLFYQVGEFFQDMAVDKSRKSIQAMMDIRPDYANVKVDGDIIKVFPEKVNVGDLILVKAGEKVPLDGIVIEGSAAIDTSALTGESMPREVESGHEVLSGSVNKNGVLTLKVTKSYGESTVSKILELVQNSGSKKAQTEKFITKFARYYTPVVVIAAALLAFIPPIFVGNLYGWINRALVFLVVSCPCALVISIPLGFFGGIGAASKLGILIKGGNYLEALKNAEIVVFDKTGTLTKGAFDVKEIVSMEGFTQEEVLEAAAKVESYSNHPIALSIVKAYGKAIDKEAIDKYQEIAGKGLSAQVEGKEILAGNVKLLEAKGIVEKPIEAEGTLIHVAIDNKYAGTVIIADTIKKDSPKAIGELKKIGITTTVMLTGDNKKTADSVAKELKVDKVYSELLPQDKVQKLEELYGSKSEKGKLIFVGDGINDAPVLARADVGIAMGGIGSDAAIEAADVVIMTDEPSKIAAAVKIARRTSTIVMQNIVFALAVKAVILIMGALGIATMWEAVFGDVGVALIAVLNSMRALSTK
ncbi:cadmium-translocating P-type ATPase [Clostridium sp. 19966]|uniref:heavy metal translocating P-type ATPase n=1 Tax=Clostridium sp. 19966 TaxID=2768166 RepID=UPI0028DE4B03|nr:heavy metal translocating P-type ATPase [Clostridium sp. 19966]MDT8716190.1 cadmium-translocating P-type ATPase [Clostridium sp. 19966]